MTRVCPRDLRVFSLSLMDTLQRSLDNTRHEKPETEAVQGSQAGLGCDSRAVSLSTVPSAACGDPNIQYQFSSEPAQVTYRVVQVTDQQSQDPNEGGSLNVVSAAAFPGAPQAVAQAVIHNPFSNGGSPVGEAASAETRFAYFPAAAVTDGAVSAQTDPSLTQSGGQLYVMMTSPDVLQTTAQRSLVQRQQAFSVPVKMDGPRTPRDERRRAQHNEVERRRRDKINNWIVTLSKIIPDCGLDSTKTGASKGGILSKACDYIRELRQSNQHLQESLKEVERIQVDNELRRRQIEELKNENALLRAQLQQHGVEAPPQ